MSEDPRLEEAFRLIRAVVADADARARSTLVAELTGGRSMVAHPPVNTNADQTDGFSEKRAPRGSAAVLIDRALSEAGDDGLTVFGIQAKAANDFEKLVSLSAIRNWLKENERKNPPRYRQVGGVWFLASRAPKIKAVS